MATLFIDRTIVQTMAFHVDIEGDEVPGEFVEQKLAELEAGATAFVPTGAGQVEYSFGDVEA